MSESPEKQYALRLPSDLYGELEQWAKEEVRSVNGQIVAILRDAVSERRARRHAARRSIDRSGTLESDTLSPDPDAVLVLDRVGA